MPKNPCINLAAVKDLTDEERKLAEGIIATQGMNKGRLRASAPESPALQLTAETNPDTVRSTNERQRTP